LSTNHPQNPGIPFESPKSLFIFAARFTRLPVAKAFSIPDMIIVQIKDNETVDRALKRFKKKFERTGVLKELRRRTFFQKPSITKRKLKQKAVYKLATYGTENE
jgi:small subunit ribosomal protein S21